MIDSLYRSLVVVLILRHVSFRYSEERVQCFSNAFGIGNKIGRRVLRLFGDYTHMGGSKTALVILKGGNAELAHFMAMQIASMSPTYVSSKDMPADVVEHERKVQTEIVKNDEKFAGKPENVINGAIEGKVSKALKEMCLVDQEYFMDTAKKVSAVLKENNAEVLCFERYTVGEGIEKREENFAEEVAKQMNA